MGHVAFVESPLPSLSLPSRAALEEIKVVQRMELHYLNSYGQLKAKYMCDQISNPPSSKTYMTSMHMQPWFCKNAKQQRRNHFEQKKSTDDVIHARPNSPAKATLSAKMRGACFRCSAEGHFANNCLKNKCNRATPIFPLLLRIHANPHRVYPI
jgi:hypothetical protein